MNLKLNSGKLDRVNIDAMMMDHPTQVDPDPRSMYQRNKPTKNGRSSPLQQHLSFYRFSNDMGIGTNAPTTAERHFFTELVVEHEIKGQPRVAKSGTPSVHAICFA